MSKEKLQAVSRTSLRLMRAEDRRHRSAAIQALTPVMNALIAKEITAEEYQSFVGETYAQTLTRQFVYQLQDARDVARNHAEDGLIDGEEMAKLMARLDAAGCPMDGDGTTLAETVTMPSVDDEDQGESQGEAEEVAADE